MKDEIAYSSITWKNENLVKLQMTSIDMSKVALVREICEQTNSKIVIISSWKSLSIYDELEKELIKTGLPIIDKTIDMKNRRGTEIKNYLDSHELENYVIIDDTYYDDYEDKKIWLLVHIHNDDI